MTRNRRRIGLQIARELASNGFTALVGARNLERGEAAAAEIEGDARAIQLDDYTRHHRGHELPALDD